MDDVVRCQVFLVDMNNYKLFNEIYKEFFTGDYPARAVVEVSELPAGGLVEIMAEARNQDN
jgi:2-iminobutanoate/2-iminopropanoate deaminase